MAKRVRKKRKLVSEKDFSYESLPHTRPQVFKSVFKTNFLYIFKIALLLTAFIIPLFLWETLIRLDIVEIQSQLNDSNKAEILAKTFGYSNIKCIVDIPLFFIASLGFGGAIHSLQRLVWNEMVFVSDFFTSLKKGNWIKYLGFGFIFAASYWLLEFTYFGIPLTDLSTLARMIVYGIGFIQFIFFTSLVFYMYFQNESYNLTYGQMFSNGIKFVFKTFLQNILFIALLFFGFAVVIFDQPYINVIGLFVFAITSTPALICFILNSNYMFDKWINCEQFPEAVDRGVYKIK